MKYSEFKEKVEELERQVKELKAEVERKENTEDWPKCGDIYWLIGVGGETFHDYWKEDTIYEDCLAIGNCFKTKDDAKFAVEKLKVIHELKQFARPHVGGGKDICIYYNNHKDCLAVTVTGSFQYAELYFESKERAREAINAVGEDRVKKYYLGVAE